MLLFKTDQVKAFFKALTSMQAAIYLLILIAVLSAIVTIIPQGEDSTFYLQHYGQGLGAFINLLGLDHLYRVGWYQFLLGLLCLSLLLCSCQRLGKGRNLPRIGSLLVHLGMIIILLGAAWSLGYARQTHLQINQGEAVLLKDYGFKEGYLQVNNFKVDYYPDHTPRQYYSDISLRDYQGRSYEQIISVNHPLKAGLLKIYQASWGWSMQADVRNGDEEHSLVLQDGIALPLPDHSGIKLQALFIPDYREDDLSLTSESPFPHNPRMLATLLIEGKIVAMTVLAPGESQELGGCNIVFNHFAPYTGLTIKEDPGVNIVFAGFVILLLGMLARYGKLYRREAA